MNVNQKNRKIVLELLSFCNLNCKHCLYRNFDSKYRKGYLSWEKFCSIIDYSVNNNIEKVVFTGGEPTLHPDFFKMAEYAILKISKVSICTNGFFFSEKLRDDVIRLNFSTYTISIDSHLGVIHDKFRGKTGSFDSAVDFLEKLKENNKNISIHITIHPENIDQIEKTIDFCKKFSSEIIVSSVYHKSNKVNLNENFLYKKQLEKFKKENICRNDIILVGFNEFCKSKNCLDGKNIFMINKDGETVECYWKRQMKTN